MRFVLTGGVMADKESSASPLSLPILKTGVQLWSQTFDGTLTDIFAMQDRSDRTHRQKCSTTDDHRRCARERERASTPQVADLPARERIELNPQSLANHQAMEALFRQALAIEPNNVRSQGAVGSDDVAKGRQLCQRAQTGSGWRGSTL